MDNTLSNAYAAANIWRIAYDGEACVCGPSPTLNQCINDGRGQEVRDIILQLIDMLADFTSARYKFSTSQRAQLASIILSMYGSLKIKQLHHFFALAMAGEYGKFYDRLEPMDITSALRTYTTETVNSIWAIKNERTRARESEERQRIENDPEYQKAAAAARVQAWEKLSISKRIK